MTSRKTLLIIFLSIFCFQLSAQVTFRIQSLPAYTPSRDSIFIAGDFTGWQPGSKQFVLQKNSEGKWSITLAAQSAGTIIKFKFTRGAWATVEKSATGGEISDRTFTFGTGNTTVDINIANWADAGGGTNSTAAANVKIMSTNFDIPQLNRKRKIWIYLPPDYEISAIRYPVLYMHDGQNLFDAATSFSGEWEVDETLNKLAAQGKHVPIVIGIDNGGNDRISEYTPWKNTQYGGGDGDKYIRFIVETLKPYIDQNYRTLSTRENTGIMGSSLGGLISHYGALKYQEVFGKAGLFSPSYWFSDNIWPFTHTAGKRFEMRFFQLCGTNESAGMVAEMQRMNDSLISLGFSQDKIKNKIVTGGQHNEKLWREAFAEAYLWLFDSYSLSIEEPIKKGKITCYPNPVNDFLTFKSDRKIRFDSVLITNMEGQLVKTFSNSKENKFLVNDLVPGTYIVRCRDGNLLIEGKFIKK